MQDSTNDAFDPVRNFYRVLKIGGAAFAAVIGVSASLAALDDSVKQWFGSTPFSPLHAMIVVILVFVCMAVVESRVANKLKRASESEEDAKSKARALEASVSNFESRERELQELVYYDSVTGIPNSNYLRAILNRKNVGRSKLCLILLDLRNFGEINKKFNHWRGDEYLARFASLVNESGRRNEHLIRCLPLTDEADLDLSNARAFRKSSGGDEFFILIQGTIVDGLGYLTRLNKRSDEFNEMARSIFDADHPFGFSAGLTMASRGGPDPSDPSERFALAVERASIALQKATECKTSNVYWAPWEFELFDVDDFGQSILNTAIDIFGDPHLP